MITPADRIEIEKGQRGIDLKDIALEEQPIELAEVVVKPLVEISAEEIVYNLDQDPDRETSTLHEILDKVPMVGRTPDNKLFVDNPFSSFLVVRNGKEDALFKGMSIDQILKAIPAKAFAKVRVLLAPPEGYGSYQYVLDIETDERNILFGVVGSTYLELNNNEGKLLVAPSVTGNLEKLRFSGGVLFEGDRVPVERQFSEQSYTSTQLRLNQEQEKRSSGENGGDRRVFQLRPFATAFRYRRYPHHPGRGARKYRCNHQTDLRCRGRGLCR